MNGPVSFELASRQVIQDRLLAALDDKSKVAVLLTKEDLQILIRALAPIDRQPERQFCQDLQSLLDAAFPIT